MDRAQLFVTGFGSFGQFDVNPTSILAPQLSPHHTILPVTYADAETFVTFPLPAGISTLLMLGVSAKAETILLETTARNLIGRTPDASGVVAGPMPINPRGPQQIGATLWHDGALMAPGQAWATSVDAGDYLCNYLSYRALEQFPNLRVGFVHVPPFSTMVEAAQIQALSELIAAL